MNSQTSPTAVPASLGKRFLSIFYDLLITFFLSFIITLIVQSVLISSGLVELETVQISKTETISTIPANSIVNTLLKSLWLVIPFFYFTYYWTTKGRTLGMKVWKIQAISTTNSNSQSISWLQAGLRYCGALFGLGYLWMLADKENLPLQDRLSKTRLIKQDKVM